jgi:hypothetical protein
VKCTQRVMVVIGLSLCHMSLAPSAVAAEQPPQAVVQPVPPQSSDFTPSNRVSRRECPEGEDETILTWSEPWSASKTTSISLDRGEYRLAGVETFIAGTDAQGKVHYDNVAHLCQSVASVQAAHPWYSRWWGYLAVGIFGVIVGAVLTQRSNERIGTPHGVAASNIRAI